MPTDKSTDKSKNQFEPVVPPMPSPPEHPGAVSESPQPSATQKEAKPAATKTSHYYRVGDSVLELKTGAVIPDQTILRYRGDVVKSDEFESRELEQRYVGAGAIEPIDEATYKQVLAAKAEAASKV